MNVSHIQSTPYSIRMYRMVSEIRKKKKRDREREREYKTRHDVIADEVFSLYFLYLSVLLRSVGRIVYEMFTVLCSDDDLRQTQTHGRTHTHMVSTHMVQYLSDVTRIHNHSHTETVV